LNTGQGQELEWRDVMHKNWFYFVDHSRELRANISSRMLQLERDGQICLS
jgi:hypothetical protein